MPLAKIIMFLAHLPSSRSLQNKSPRLTSDPVADSNPDVAREKVPLESFIGLSGARPAFVGISPSYKGGADDSDG